MHGILIDFEALGRDNAVKTSGNNAELPESVTGAEND